jgi:hypothetical protein
MNNATETEKKTIGAMIAELNAKAEAAGCEVRAEYMTIDSTYGDACGVALVGGDEAQRERAARFLETHFRKHIAPQRCLGAQYAWSDHGMLTLERFPEYISGREWVEGAGRLVRRVNQEGCPLVQARVIGLVYYPGAD